MNSLIGFFSISCAPVEALNYGMETDLVTADASFLGEGEFDESGDAVTGVGDVNGDEYNDFMIGVNGNEEGGKYVGQSYLFLGKASGWVMDTDLSNADASFWGADVGEGSGYSVAGAGDVNGDGYDDILIGTSSASDYDGYLSGKTYLIFGKPAGWSLDTNLSTSDASFRWGNLRQWCSHMVAGAGDVNGDGYDDILIGARYTSFYTGGNAGQTFLILGKPSGWARNTDLYNSDASFGGEELGDQSGTSVAGAGDVNGDGYDDILIGAPYNDDVDRCAGQTYLILGKPSGWVMNTYLSESNASFRGEKEWDESGEFIAGAGDVNGDGFDDILIGVRHNCDGGEKKGQTYLFLGKPSGWAMDTNLSESNASFRGAVDYDFSGCSVAGAGDVNGDGYDDILIGAYGSDKDGWGAGRTFVIFGKPSGWNMGMNLSFSDMSFVGENTLDHSGTSVAGVGDVNGDGYDDILIGAPENGESGDYAGQTYLIFPNPKSRPCLYDENLTPDKGNTSTNFTFSIEYKDIDGDTPINFSLVIDDHMYSMNRNGTAQIDYENGIRYSYILNLSEGIHQYYYSVFDGIFDSRFPRSGYLHTPNVSMYGVDNDSDGDGFYDINETEKGSDPYDQYSTPLDFDADGWNNSIEMEVGTDPRDNASFPPDMDEDWIPDSIDSDKDGDGVTNADDAFPEDRDKWEEPEPIDEDVPETTEEKSAVVWWGVWILVAVLVIGAILGVVVAVRGKRKEERGGAVDKFGRVGKERG